MKKHTLATLLVSLIFSFALGFFVATLIHPREKYRTHTRTYYHANGKVLREVNSLINIDEILAAEIQDGTDTRYDETGTIVEQGEWKDGKPWNGRCWIPEAGDAGSWGGLGKFRTVKKGIFID